MSEASETYPAAVAGARHRFVDRHIGPSAAEQATMLGVVGFDDLDDLVGAAVPQALRARPPRPEPEPLSEEAAHDTLHEIGDANAVYTPMIGLGYHDTVTPAVIRRNVLENPAWYTAYTPYQPEISQGRLEALLNFQTMVADLTALPIANASMLDEATAAAEAMTLARRATARRHGAASTFVVDADALPQTIAVLRTRAEPLGIELVVADLDDPDALPDSGVFGVLAQYPGVSGAIRDLAPLAAAAHTRGAQLVVAADPLALTLLAPPGEAGADIAVGSTQRFGVPIAGGGPHAAYLAVRDGLQRQLPGRLVGVSLDADGEPGYRLALQTREQHIRRERATSNICTAQVLLAVVAAMYAVYHGPQGLVRIARQVHAMAGKVALALREAGIELVHEEFFDTVQARVPGRADAVIATAAKQHHINLRRVDADTVGVTCDEVTDNAHVAALVESFGIGERAPRRTIDALPSRLLRTGAFLTHPVFHEHRSETALLRYLRTLADRDLALDRTMIPLGSCTMKLNATAEMEPISWPQFARIHPYAPAEQLAGNRRLVGDLARRLGELTGYPAVSMQPNAGSQGELAGLLAIRAYHRACGESGRDVCLIPSSAHGTNAASAVLAGLRVVVVACDAGGNIDLAALQAAIDKHRDALAAIMITYPSTHGVYEETLPAVSEAVHAAGGQVYIDGANLNALLGLVNLGAFGDVSHLNLHKTFCIPHGGGGPGVGPIAVREHLAPYLPGDPLAHGENDRPVAAAPYGSAGILPISWAYLMMMGSAGLRAATCCAVLAANYLAKRLASHYPILYTGRSGLVAHECIVDLRPLTKETGITVDDVAKRLIDYGFHAPTMSFPVPGTLMVEPTESEDLAELDRFVAAMVAIRGEIEQVATGEFDRTDNPLTGAPHTARSLIAGEWKHPYDRETAGYPAGLAGDKYWPPVRRIDQAYGDRNLVCACPSPESFEE